MSTGVKGESFSPDREAEFLGIKSRIAMLHDSFMTALQADRNIGQSMLTIVGRTITLQHMARLSVAEIKKIEIEWHQAFLLLQETLGNIEDKREEISEISEAAFRAGKAKMAAKQRVDRIFKSNTFIGLCIFGAIAFATVGVQVLGIWDWSNLRRFGPTKAAFYYTYDKGVRFLLPSVPYYRLDWVVFPVADKEIRDWLPGGFWRYDLSSQTNAPPITRTDIEDDILSRANLSQSTLDEIKAAADKKDLWTYNSNDFIVMSLYLMQSGSQADRLAQEIRNSVSNDTRLANVLSAGSRANILIIYWMGVEDNSQASRDAFSEYQTRGHDLIK
jgi:hypothetical protein